MKNRLIYLMLPLVLCACVGAVPQQKVGVENAEAAKNIMRANKLSDLRRQHRYDDLADELRADLKRYENIPFANLRIRNELADIYTRNLMDLEAAIEQDGNLLRIERDEGRQSIAVDHLAASNQIVGDKEYLDQYINIDEKTIRSQAQNRLEANMSLLAGKEPLLARNYGEQHLLHFIAQVSEDVNATYPHSPERVRMVSRLIRGEYEYMRNFPNGKINLVGYKYIQNGEIKVREIDYNEINFLSLSRYFQKVFEKTLQTELADWALQTIYRPYINLQNSDARWTYNKLVNEFLNSLVETGYANKKYEDMLYFASLNKSRMILEDQANNGQSRNQNLSAVIKADSLIDKSTGLPSRATFASKLRLAKNYLDIYVVGGYKTVQKNSAEDIKAKSDSSQAISSTRAVGVSRKASSVEIPTTNKLIISHIKNGQVVAVEQKSMAEAEKLRSEYDSLYQNISGQSGEIRGVGVGKKTSQSASNVAVKNRLFSGKLDDDLVVSPDKWVSKYPLSYLLNNRTTRSLNLLSYGEPNKLSDIKLVGYFNPQLANSEGNLAGSEAEAGIVKQIIPNAEIHLRENASLKAINQPNTSNIVHLSMHGMNNPEDPIYSKLLLAGSTFDGSTADSNALYAKDMVNVPQLKGKELIFTAACETGLTRGSSNNASELLGILRPLLINDNKNIILTLWAVDDASTKDFVRFFYQNLASGKNIKAAFYKAVDELKKKYPSPSDWAAFYLIQNG